MRSGQDTTQTQVYIIMELCLPYAGDSFSPYLRTANAMAFVGGSEYFPVLADTLVQAQQEILIADWWLTPEVYLKRNPIQVICFDEP